jgi:hypothetical protein
MPAAGLWENTTTMGCNAKKTNKQTNKETLLYVYIWVPVTAVQT